MNNTQTQPQRQAQAPAEASETAPVYVLVHKGRPVGVYTDQCNANAIGRAMWGERGPFYVQECPLDGLLIFDA